MYIKSFFVFLLLIVSVAGNVGYAKSVDKVVRTETKKTEIGYETAERVALKKQLVQIEASNTSPKSSSCK